MAGQRLSRDFVPLLGGKTRDEDVVLARELPGNRDDLLGAFSAGKDDFGEPEAPRAVEVEHELGKRHEVAF